MPAWNATAIIWKARAAFSRNTCTTHTYDDRLETIGYLKKAGIKICSGGIIGMGETREDRCDLAFELKEIGANVVPVNILNPIPGTPFEKMTPLPAMEILKTIACFRFILPRQEIMVAGGRTVNLRDAQSMIFMAGASALMVGNYLTTLNQPVEKDLQMLKDLGLDPSWDKHGFSDQEEEGCGCGNEKCENGCCLKTEQTPSTNAASLVTLTPCGIRHLSHAFLLTRRIGGPKNLPMMLLRSCPAIPMPIPKMSASH